MGVAALWSSPGLTSPGVSDGSTAHFSLTEMGLALTDRCEAATEGDTEKTEEAVLMNRTNTSEH